MVQARFTTSGGEVVRRYNGHGTQTNWVNANAEYMGVLNLAMGDALRNVATDAADLCAGRVPMESGVP